MDSKLIFQIKNAEVRFVPEYNSSLIQFNGLVNHENYKIAMEKAYDLIVEKKLPHWISDLSDMKVIIPENQKWTNEYFLPKVLSTTKISKVAIIVGNDVFTHASMNKIRDEVSKANLPIRYFDKIHDIKEWFLAATAAQK